MPALTVNTIDWDGLDVESAYTAAAADQEFANDGRTFVHVKNTDSSSHTITFVTTRTVENLAVADNTVTIGADTGEKMIGPFPTGTYNASDGNVDITWSDTTGMSICVLKLP